MKVSVEPISSGYEVLPFECPEHFQNMVGYRTRDDGDYSVYSSAAPPARNGGEIVLQPEKLTPVVVGKPGVGFVIWKEEMEPLGVREPGRFVQLDLGPGSDRDFLACADELGPELARAARSLLAEVRALQPGGNLREGGNRKFVNYPDNFVGFTCQPRRRAILVHVRNSQAARNPGTLSVAADRRPYIRFWVESERQLGDAVRLIQGSWLRE